MLDLNCWGCDICVFVKLLENWVIDVLVEFNVIG